MYTSHEYAEMAARANAEGKLLEVIDGKLVLVEPPPPPEPEIIVPESISPRQVRLALLEKGLLDAVEGMIKQQGKLAEIEWEFAGSIDKNHPMVQQLIPSLGWSEDDLNQFIIHAAGL